VSYAEFAASLDESTFRDYLSMVKNDEIPKTDIVPVLFAGFKYMIHAKCYELAQVRPDAVQFVQWLHNNGWLIVILTYRDLRFCLDSTKAWLAANNIPYQYIFMADDKIAFCKLWGVKYLIDDAPFNIVAGPKGGITTYFPITEYNRNLDTPAIGFHSFNELYQHFRGVA
jgi:hypothetical protein